MFDAIAHALLSLSPELDTAKVEEVPMRLKAWIDGSRGNLRRESMGAKCLGRHFFAIWSVLPRVRRGCAKLAVDKSL